MSSHDQPAAHTPFKCSCGAEVTTPTCGICGSGRTEHKIEACFNNGWDDAPAWSVICDCAWEVWDQPSEAEARRKQRQCVTRQTQAGLDSPPLWRGHDSSITPLGCGSEPRPWR